MAQKPQLVKASSLSMIYDNTFGRSPLDELSARSRDLYLTTYTSNRQTPCPCMIRTSNPSKRAAADPCIGPRGHWDRHFIVLYMDRY